MVRSAHWIVAAGCLFSLLAARSPGQDWPQFRGPLGNGISQTTKAASKWNAETNVAWSTEIAGEGWSSPIVSRGRVFVSTAVAAAPGDDESSHRFELHCYDLASGKLLWARLALEGQPRAPRHQDNTFASETPATDGERIVVSFGMNGVFCFDFDGQLLWQKELGVFPMQADWGTSSSPAMHGGLVFLQMDNEQESFLVALDAKSGDERWKIARDEKTTWCSPIVWTNKVRTELVTGGKTIRSYNPADGELLWQLAVGERASSASPAGDAEMLIVGGRGLFAVRAGASGDITPEAGATTSAGVIWAKDRGAPGMSSPLVYRGYVYIPDRRGGIVACYDAASGEEAFRERLPGEREFWASPWAVGDTVYCLDDSGATHCLAPGGEFRLLNTNQLEGRFWASVAVADGNVLLRSSDKLYCIREAPASDVRAARAGGVELPVQR